MTKFQEDDIYDIHCELRKNPKLEETFQKELLKIKQKEKHRYTPFFDRYWLAYQKAKKKVG
jgi:hypothetical protein